MQIQLADHQTSVLRRGESGPAVVLIHSLSADRQMWEPTLDRLADGRRVFAYDIRGHGDAAGSPRPFTMQDLSTDLYGVLDALELPTAHVVGLSYGGGIAQTAAVTNPDRFESLALLATTDHPFPEGFEQRAASAEVDGMEAQLEPSLTRWFTPEALAADAPGVKYARDCVLTMDPADWAAAWRSMKELDVQGRLAGFGRPVLVVAGDKDLSCPPEFLHEVAERIPNSTFRVLPGVPHLQTLERPGLITETLDEFLPKA